MMMRKLQIRDELQTGLKIFIAKIHPDRLLETSADFIENNVETFKHISTMIRPLYEAFSTEGDERPIFPFKVKSLKFVNVQGLNLLEHTLYFTTDKHDLDTTRDFVVSWKEASLSLFHLLTKAHIEYDQRLSQWLLSDLYASNNKRTIDEDFGTLIENFNMNTENFDLNRAAKDLEDIARFLSFDRTLSTIDKRKALESAWRIRNTLRIIHRIYPEMQFVFDSKRTSPQLDEYRSIYYFPIHING